MYSTDKNLEIAKELGVKIYMHENLRYADFARAFGLAQCSYDWILALDSDELVPEKLKAKILNVMEQNNFDAQKIPRKNFFFGQEFIGLGWSFKDDLVPRFFRKCFLNYGREVHHFNKIEPNTRVGEIVGSDISIIHFNYDSVYQFTRKLNTYTDNEVNSTKYNYKGNPALKIIYHFFREVLGRFIYKKGYKDGWLGLYLSLAMAFYRASAVAKSNLTREEEVIKKYQRIKE